MDMITIVSEAFNPGGKIPAEYTCVGQDKSPQLTWTGIPDKTASIALFMYDLDSPKLFVHWAIYNISPSIRGLPKGVPNTPTLTPWPFGNGTCQALNDFGNIGYGGPCPPPIKSHRYFFKIYALDKKLDTPPGTSHSRVSKDMEFNILATGELVGTYGRW